MRFGSAGRGVGLAVPDDDGDGGSVVYGGYLSPADLCLMQLSSARGTADQTLSYVREYLQGAGRLGKSFWSNRASVIARKADSTSRNEEGFLSARLAPRMGVYRWWGTETQPRPAGPGDPVSKAGISRFWPVGSAVSCRLPTGPLGSLGVTQ